MSDEELEELKEFTIDLNDIDDLALGLEICSKKSNMVIQEFIDTIVQLQQENQSLRKENKILRENAEHNDKVVDKVNWENLKLKKQIEYLRESVERKEETIIELEHERVPYTNEYVEELKKQLEEYKRLCFVHLINKCNKLENQQKEFIEFLEKEKDRLARECSPTYEGSLGKKRFVNEDIFNEVDKILSKYYEIIDK